jgi:uncharacterized delta-60 repeat protein
MGEPNQSERTLNRGFLTLGSNGMRMAISGGQFRRVWLTAFITVTAVFLRLPMRAADGALDPAFGSAGTVLTKPVGTLIGGNEEARALLCLPDGKLLVAGISSSLVPYEDFALIRLNPNGSRDTTFGVGGQVTTAIGTDTDRLETLIRQTDGKLVAAGHTQTPSGTDFALVRYHANGSLDTSFGGDGIVTTSLGVGVGDDKAYALVQQSDGKLVAAGYTYNGSNFDIALVRYDIDGTLDPSFGGDGVVTTAIGTTDDVAYGIVQQADGKLVVAGNARSNGDYDFALVRYNLDGSLDSSFGGDGIVVTSLGTSTDIARALIQQSDGKLVAAGNANGVAVLRYLDDGSLDTSFDSDGRAALLPGTNPSIEALVQQADGRLVVAGSVGGLTGDFALVRYNADGSLDATLDGDGIVLTNIAGSEDAAFALVQQPDGKLVAAGTTRGGTDATFDFALVRWNPDGTLDASFDGDGTLRTGTGRRDAVLYGVTRQADGKLVAVGSAKNGTYRDFVVIRYTADGALDPSFGGGGIVLTDVGGRDDTAYAVVQQSDGKLAVAGSALAFNSSTFWTLDVGLARYNLDGSLDTGFGGDGTLAYPIGTADDYAYALIQQSDGKLVTAGGSASDYHHVALLRVNADGTLDNTFDGDGKLVTLAGSSGSVANALLQQSDGKLVAAGYASQGTSTMFAVIRYTFTGSLDPSFDGDGIATTDVSTSIDRAHAIIQQSDGKLVAAGYSHGVFDDFALVRYLADGSLDSGFGTGGVVVTDIGSYYDRAYALVQQPDGKLVAAGSSSNSSSFGREQFTLVRYRIDGSLDPSLDGDGKAAVSIGSSDATARALVQQPDGALVLGGYAFDGSGNRVFALARFSSTVCGDGQLGGDEECDLGAANGTPGTCCTVQCAFAPTTTVCRPASFDCDLAETCTGCGSDCPPEDDAPCTPTPTASATTTATHTTAATDTPTPISSDTATPTAAPETETPTVLPTATPATICPVLPVSGCRAAGKSLLIIGHQSSSHARLLWKWLRGQSTALGDLGNPRDETPFAFCVYDAAGLRLFADLAPGPGWSARSHGFRYRDPAAIQDGIRKADLRSSDDNKARFRLSGNGMNLPDPMLPWLLPVTAQLLNGESGLCWQDVYVEDDVLRNRSDSFKGKTRTD